MRLTSEAVNADLSPSFARSDLYPGTREPILPIGTLSAPRVGKSAECIGSNHFQFGTQVLLPSHQAGYKCIECHFDSTQLVNLEGVTPWNTYQKSNRSRQAAQNQCRAGRRPFPHERPSSRIREGA